MSDDMPEMVCPRCKAVMPDFDGFGVIYHEACGFCRHMSKSSQGGSDVWVCDYCRRVIVREAMRWNEP